ncbi:phage tail protein [Undibacterium sp. CCC3.4]|nr:phage tail protein [Undibacterium sp. CCC3.4]MEB0215570.1 phage tail protein [Undibacterium sp. 5I2]WPX43723.1 phage tail protein [Undibacterium sp. CCC3.4]
MPRGLSHRPHWPTPLPTPQVFGNILPVGAIIAFAGQLGTSANSNLEASGWMLCDGRSLAISMYQELYAYLGFQYGGSDEAFLIPDLRGYFLRGADPDAKIDQDAAHRQPLGSGKPSDVGSLQSDALQNHVHLAAPGGVPVPTSGPPLASAIAPIAPTAAVDSGTTSADSVHISAHETRPKNISVHYVIRFTNRLHHPT